jgi:hypothetical protein
VNQTKAMTRRMEKREKHGKSQMEIWKNEERGENSRMEKQRKLGNLLM